MLGTEVKASKGGSSETVGSSRAVTTSSTSPEATLRGFVAAIATADLDAAALCFTRDACLVTPDSTAVRDRDGIRPILAQLILTRAEIRIDRSTVLVSGEVALIRGSWTIRAGAEDARYNRTLDPTIVMRLVEGEWKLAIAHPWGV